MTHRFHVTGREQQILTELVRDGPCNETIARRLGMSYDTVKDHMKRMLKKADAPSRTSLVVGVLRGTLVPVTVQQDRTGERYEMLADVGL